MFKKIIGSLFKKRVSNKSLETSTLLTANPEPYMTNDDIQMYSASRAFAEGCMVVVNVLEDGTVVDNTDANNPVVIGKTRI